MGSSGLISWWATIRCDGFSSPVITLYYTQYGYPSPSPIQSCSVQKSNDISLVYSGETCGGGLLKVADLSAPPLLPKAPAGETLYFYDALGRLMGRSDSVNPQRVYSYDEAGNRKSVSNR